jgi:hypothetical protein
LIGGYLISQLADPENLLVWISATCKREYLEGSYR